MNFFNRAIRNVTRRLSKSVLLLITFFVIGNFVIIGLGVSSASETAKTLTRQKMRAVVTYSIDYDSIWEYTDTITDEDVLNEFYNNYPKITVDEINELLKDERVKTANATSVTQLYGIEGEIDFVTLGNDAEQNNVGGTSCYYDEENKEICTEYVNPNFSAKGNFFPDMIEIVEGDFTIENGRFYTQDEIESAAKVVLVSKALAEKNGLRVGDNVKFYSQSPSEIQSGWLSQYGLTLDDIVFEAEVIGIYDHNKKITPDSENFNWTMPYENYDNMLLMPGSTLYNMNSTYQMKVFDYYAEMNPDDEYYSNPDNRPTGDYNKDDIYINDVTLLLNDPMEVDQFVEDYKDSVAQFKKLDANNDEFNRLAKPLDTLSLYATFIVWLVVINAIVIITLVTALTLKTREYEIGVLLSIGASKFKIIAQFFVELALVAVLGFTLSIVSGSLIANKVGATVLDYQIAASDVTEENDRYNHYESIWDTNYTTDVSLEDLVSEYNVSISPVIIGEIYVVGLGIVLISILIPSMMIMRFNPKRILMNQN